MRRLEEGVYEGGGVGDEWGRGEVVRLGKWEGVGRSRCWQGGMGGGGVPLLEGKG